MAKACCRYIQQRHRTNLGDTPYLTRRTHQKSNAAETPSLLESTTNQDAFPSNADKDSDTYTTEPNKKRRKTTPTNKHKRVRTELQTQANKRSRVQLSNQDAEAQANPDQQMDE